MAVLKPIPGRLEGRLPSFQGGVHPSEHKDSTAQLPTERAPLPPELILPLSMHAGAPAEPVVEKKGEVVRGQMIAKASGFVSAPIHSPVCGTVKEIAPRPHQSGRMAPAIVLAVDAEKTEALIAAEETAPIEAGIDLGAYAGESIISAVRDAGIVGLGGAAFPSFIKLLPNEKKPADIVILNGTECEPYLTADHRAMLEMPGQIIAGLRLAMKATGASRGAIGIEDNKPDAIEAMKRALREAGVPDAIEICTLKTKYPQGGERTLIPVITGRTVPIGGFPPDVGVSIFNVGTAAAIATAVVRGTPLMERILTLTGRGVRNPGNLRVQIGTPLSFLIEQRGGLTGDAGMVILGGPMMGPTAANLDLPVLKGMSGVTILTAGQTKAARGYPCIRCGRCVDACPMGLMPALLMRLCQHRRPADALAAHLMACVECGTCGYVCPSHIPLVQYIRSGKTQARALQTKQN